MTVRTAIAALATIASSVIIATNVAPSNAEQTGGCKTVSVAQTSQNGARYDSPGRTIVMRQVVTAITRRCHGEYETTISLSEWIPTLAP